MFAYLDICSISTYVGVYNVYEYQQAMCMNTNNVYEYQQAHTVIHLVPQVVSYMQQKSIGKEI